MAVLFGTSYPDVYSLSLWEAPSARKSCAFLANLNPKGIWMFFGLFWLQNKWKKFLCEIFTILCKRLISDANWWRRFVSAASFAKHMCSNGQIPQLSFHLFSFNFLCVFFRCFLGCDTGTTLCMESCTCLHCCRQLTKCTWQHIKTHCCDGRCKKNSGRLTCFLLHLVGFRWIPPMPSFPNETAVHGFCSTSLYWLVERCGCRICMFNVCTVWIQFPCGIVACGCLETQWRFCLVVL